jgi:hypothetical protein
VSLPPCPECWSGKHRTCNDVTWDDHADDFAPCPCKAAGHAGELEHAPGLQHKLGCALPDVHVTHAVTKDLFTCRSCHAEALVPKLLPS